MIKRVFDIHHNGFQAEKIKSSPDAAERNMHSVVHQSDGYATSGAWL